MTKSKKQKKSRSKTKSKTQKKPMEVEYEARFLEIDHDKLIEKMKELNAVQKRPATLYRRAVFGLCDMKKGYVRVRDEGDKTTMTAKIYKDAKFPEEYELTIKDELENGKAFLAALNLTEKSYHETIREKWRVPYRGKEELCEVAIDYIPGLPTYAEVECKSKKDLNTAVKLLGLNRKNMRFGGYGKVFAEYYGMAENDINNEISSITFKDIKTELAKYVKKNEELLDRMAKEHLDIYNKVKNKE
jgi:CYTH domain-containing protein